MIVDALLFVLGLALLLGGGHVLVSAASKIAVALGVSELVIGMTIVAFGTSSPELAVNVLAALSGDTTLAFGNVVGSNIANIGLVIGLCAIVRVLEIEDVVISREIPMMMLASLAALILGWGGFDGGADSYSRSDGLMLLLLFSVFLYYSASDFADLQAGSAAAEASKGIAHTDQSRLGLRAPFFGVLGLGLLVVGAHLTVTNAVALSEAIGISKAIVGLTVVAVGTSLPELATSLVAATRGQTNLAVGNVVGSNIFNLLFILGTTATIHPVHLPQSFGGVDLAVMILFGAVLIPLAWWRGARITRAEGIVLVFGYLGFMGWRVLGV